MTNAKRGLLFLFVAAFLSLIVVITIRNGDPMQESPPRDVNAPSGEVNTSPSAASTGDKKEAARPDDQAAPDVSERSEESPGDATARASSNEKGELQASQVRDGQDAERPVVDADFSAVQTEFEATYTEYMDTISAARWGMYDNFVLLQRPDVLLRKMVQIAFEKGGSLEKTQQLLGDAVQWQEIPARLEQHSENGILGMEREDLIDVSETTRPILLYRHATCSSGKELTLIQASFVSDDHGGRIRVRTEPWTVLASSDGIKAATVTAELDWTRHDSPLTGLNVIDVIPGDCSEAVVAVIYDPSTPWHICNLHVYVWDSEQSQWQGLSDEEWQDISNWEYDPKSGLSVYASGEGDTDALVTTLDVRGQAQELLKRRAAMNKVLNLKSEHAPTDAQHEESAKPPAAELHEYARPADPAAPHE